MNGPLSSGRLVPRPGRDPDADLLDAVPGWPEGEEKIMAA